ncbi:MAG: hypothetical protein AAF385_13400 [Pseudomonadota bacterium]
MTVPVTLLTGSTSAMTRIQHADIKVAVDAVTRCTGLCKANAFEVVSR